MESELYKGDVIAFRDDKDYVVTHRIVDVTIKNGKEEFITKGDNNNKNDTGTVKNSRIEGKYVFKISKLGDVLLQLKKTFILCILLIVIIGTGIIWILFENKKLSIEERRELEKYRRDYKK